VAIQSWTSWKLAKLPKQSAICQFQQLKCSSNTGILGGSAELGIVGASLGGQRLNMKGHITLYPDFVYLKNRFCHGWKMLPPLLHLELPAVFSIHSWVNWSASHGSMIPVWR
jgi:hypothetical protein